MKNLLFIFLCVIIQPIIAQESSPKIVIDDFFKAFHAKDTATIKQYCHSEIILQTIANTKEGNKLESQVFGDFLRSLITIPDNMRFHEKLLDYKIDIDGNLAHVWTPYEFYINNQLSHIGANSFTLYNENGNWVIIHLIDTRRKK